MLDKNVIMENTFQKLKVWQKSHETVLKIYKITKNFPKEENFRLTDQICRSISSVAANIVEGNSRKSKNEFLHFLNIARSSLEETKYHLLLAKDLGYIKETTYNEVVQNCNEIGKMITKLTQYLKSKI
jgi:four helix bundle protein